MKIGFASDHAGFDLKMGLLEYLKEKAIPYVDFGCGPDEKVDYVDYAQKAVQGFNSGLCDRLILVCGTGIGMSIIANKYKGINATLCCDDYMADMSRKHNASNCLTLGGRILPLDEAIEIVSVWLATEFEAGRHKERLNKIEQIEKINFK